jgi:hypothetical protein
MVSEVFTQWSTDHALLAHGYLLGFAVFSTAVVAAGIIWENGPLEAREVATRLVIWGVAAEAICTVALFVFDEGISNSQQSKIIALERRLAPRSIQGHAYDLVVALKPFAGTEFDAATNVHDNEQTHLLVSLINVLSTAGWKQVAWKYSAGGISYNLNAASNAPEIGDVASYDVEIQMHRESLEQLKPAAEALISVLRAIDIPAHGTALDAKTINNANAQAVHLLVGQRL